jgi:hypothetical protein
VISRLRRAIAVALAVAVTILTLGRVAVDARGGAGARDETLDPGRAAAVERIG